MSRHFCICFVECCFLFDFIFLKTTTISYITFFNYSNLLFNQNIRKCNWFVLRLCLHLKEGRLQISGQLRINRPCDHGTFVLNCNQSYDFWWKKKNKNVRVIFHYTYKIDWKIPPCKEKMKNDLPKSQKSPKSNYGGVYCNKTSCVALIEKTLLHSDFSTILPVGTSRSFEKIDGYHSHIFQLIKLFFIYLCHLFLPGT